MLRVVVSQNAGAARRYFSEALERGDYYLAEGNEPGRWGGKGAELLGLSGEAGREAFDRLCGNEHPGTGARLTPRTKANRRAGFDINFHAPKSVSVAYALGGDEGIKDAFRAAVEETMRLIEEEMRARVRAGGAQEDRKTGNMVWASFIHATTRPVDGVPDPHLHAHCYAFNATFDQVEGRWKAGQFGDLKKDAPFFEACFHSRFAELLADLGYGVVRRGRFWELAGVSDSLIKRFSNRTTEIEETAKRLGVTDPNRKAELGAKTRKRKTEARPMAEVRAAWDARLSPAEADALRRPEREAAPTRVGAADAVKRSLASLLERNSVVSERRLLEEALRIGVGCVTLEGATKALGGDPEVVRREINGEVLVSTLSVIAEEKKVIDKARAGVGTMRPLASAPRGADWSAGLSEEQARAARHVLESRDRITLVRGAAGSGKTTLIRAAAAALEAAGVPVTMLAPTAEAARGVLRSHGFTGAETVASFLARDELRAAARGGVVWVDEAGLLSMRGLGQVFDAAEKVGARVVLSGDYRQHASVERGDTLRVMENFAGLRAAELSEIRRQSGSYREAVAALSEGRVGEGFKVLRELGAIREVADERERLRQVAELYVDATRSGRSVLVISPTREEGRAATAAIRQELLRRGELGKARDVLELRAKDWTEAQRGDARSYVAGDVVEFHRNAPGFRAGTRATVAAVDDAGAGAVRLEDGRTLPTALAERFSVYSAHKLELAVGDLVRVTKNCRAVDGVSRLNNGTRRRVAAFTKDGDVTLDDSRVVSVSLGHLAHGYCVTSPGSQASSADLAIVAESAGASGRAASDAQFYVSASRGRRELAVYTDDAERLLEEVSKSAQRMSAGEMLERPLTGAEQWYEDELRRDAARRDELDHGHQERENERER